MQRVILELKASGFFRIGGVALAALAVIFMLFQSGFTPSCFASPVVLHPLKPVWPFKGIFIAAISVVAAFFVGLTGFSRFLSNRQRFEGTSQQSWLLQNVIDAIPTPVFYKDTDGIYLGCNVAFEKFIGLSRVQIVGKTVYDVSPKDLADVYHAADEELFAAGGSQSYENSVVYADGSRHEVLFHKAVFQKCDGSLGGLVGTFIDITERKQAEAAALYLSHFDLTTELPNQVLFTDRIHQAIAQAHRLEQRFAIICLDLDHFKKINTAYGHSSGDRLLKKVGDRISVCLREDDTVARMGGDSFNLLLPNIGSEEMAAKVAQKILDNLKVPFDMGDREVFVTASMGVALYPYDGQDAATLLKNADTALQRAKERGRDNHYFFDPVMNARSESQMNLEMRLRRAIEADEFSLFFQPQIDTVSGVVIGAEALIRWNDPEMGHILPDMFIPLAEQSGLIGPIGDWVLREACKQAALWQRSGLPPLRIAINLSPRQFQRTDLYRNVDLALKETGLPPACLSLEVTESVAMQDVDHTIETLVRLKKLGVHLAIDDFGTGYSSLSYLRRFPIDLIKIDRSFIMDLPESQDDIAIVSAVIAMAHQLNIKVLAEGVQTLEQRDILLSHQCDELQGYLFAHPLPADEFFLRHKSGVRLPTS